MTVFCKDRATDFVTKRIRRITCSLIHKTSILAPHNWHKSINSNFIYLNQLKWIFEILCYWYSPHFSQTGPKESFRVWTVFRLTLPCFYSFSAQCSFFLTLDCNLRDHQSQHLERLLRQSCSARKCKTWIVLHSWPTLPLLRADDSSIGSKELTPFLGRDFIKGAGIHQRRWRHSLLSSHE